MKKTIPLNHSIQVMTRSLLAIHSIDPTLIWIMARIPTYFMKCRQGDHWREAYPVTTAFMYRMIGYEIVEDQYLAMEIDRMDRLALENQFKDAMFNVEQLLDASGFTAWWNMEQDKLRIESVSFSDTIEASTHYEKLRAVAQILRDIYRDVSKAVFHPDYQHFV